MLVKHPFSPIYDKNSTILILGSFPSVKSRQVQFYYGHPQNRFWKVLSCIYNVDIGNTIEEKCDFLLKKKIALWDVIKSCEITASSDASIKEPIINPIEELINKTHITQIYCNGNTAYQLFEKYVNKEKRLQAFLLPSTSPANARFRLEDLIEHWKIIKSI